MIPFSLPYLPLSLACFDAKQVASNKLGGYGTFYAHPANFVQKDIKMVITTKTGSLVGANVKVMISQVQINQSENYMVRKSGENRGNYQQNRGKLSHSLY